ncbi:MAG: O-antigen ligase domain-containing protein [Bradyrhizobiaceae bacterium]|nr:O-antigen ligase domain-containing protein [Hyphomicrobiales bacterium]MBV9426539.1 O-antigen ligase domain-containing protein [Bradyrhizobiaceae bacterium]
MRSVSVTADGLAPAAPASISVERLRSGLLWLTGVSGAFVFIEPSPYEYASLLAIFVFAATGLALRPGVMPLAILLALYNIGFSIAAIPVLDAPKTIIWVLTSWYLAATAVFFAALIAQEPRALAPLMRGTMVAAAIAALAAIVGYAQIVPALSDLFLRYGRARGTFNDPNVLGTFLIFPMMVAMGRIFAGRRGTLTACVLLVLFSAALLLSFSRGAWGQAAFATLLLMTLSFMTSRSSTERLRILLFAGGGAVVLAGLIVLLLSFDSVATLFTERFALEQGYDVGQFGRFGRHVLGALLALDHPLGLGPLQFHNLFVEDPHNAFLNAFMSGGWLSGLTYLTLMLVTLTLGLRYAFAPTPWQRAYLAVYCGFAGTFAESLIIDSDHWRHFFLLVGALWGLMLASRRYVAPTAAPQPAALAPRRSAALSTGGRSVAQPG